MREPPIPDMVHYERGTPVPGLWLTLLRNRPKVALGEGAVSYERGNPVPGAFS